MSIFAYCLLIRPSFALAAPRREGERVPQLPPPPRGDQRGEVRDCVVGGGGGEKRPHGWLRCAEPDLAVDNDANAVIRRADMGKEDDTKNNSVRPEYEGSWQICRTWPSLWRIYAVPLSTMISTPKHNGSWSRYKYTENPDETTTTKKTWVH